jgi:hypothetical protein
MLSPPTHPPAGTGGWLPALTDMSSLTCSDLYAGNSWDLTLVTWEVRMGATEGDWARDTGSESEASNSAAKSCSGSEPQFPHNPCLPELM